MGARPRKPAAAKARPRPPASRVPGILALLDEHYPASTCSLTHRNSYELLVATVLSAQCTDARVNQVTPVLFARCPTPADLNRIPLADLEQIIKSTGFFRNKAKSLKGAAHRLTTVHGGEVPRTMDELLEIPGVARKTANVVLGTGFGIASGVVVDTHVGRITRRLGLSRHEDPRKVEADLVKVLPPEHWIRFSHQLIDHGRAVCTARAPKCEACFLRELCSFAAEAKKERVPR